MKVSDKDLIKVNLKNSETGLADSVKAMYMGELVNTRNSIFNSGNYGGVDVRFFNLEENNSMDYAIVGEYLMIATSKDSGRAIIDKILMEEVRSNSAVEGAETVSVNTEKTKNIFDEGLINDKDSKEGETIIKTE